MKIKNAKVLPALLLAASVLAVPVGLAQAKGKAKEPPPEATPATSPFQQIQEWKKGDRLPAEFRDRQYVIDNWKQYSLPAPRKGMHWVGVGAQYYLVNSGGVIQQVGAGT